MGLPEPPTTTSATQLATYASCPRRYWYRYVERREPEHRAPGLALGSAIHSTIEWWFEETAQEREPTLDDALKILRADLAAALAGGEVRWNGTTPDASLAEGGRLVRHYLDQYGHIAVRETEVRFDFPIVDPDTGERLPRPLVGYFDAELARGNVLELKVVRAAFSELALRSNLQLCAYRNAARYLGVDVEVMAIVRTKRPRIQHVVLPRDRDVSTWFLRAAAEIERAILRGHYPPAPGATCPRCEYRGACLDRGPPTAARTAEPDPDGQRRCLGGRASAHASRTIVRTR